MRNQLRIASVWLGLLWLATTWFLVILILAIARADRALFAIGTAGLVVTAISIWITHVRRRRLSSRSREY